MGFSPSLTTTSRPTRQEGLLSACNPVNADSKVIKFQHFTKLVYPKL